MSKKQKPEITVKPTGSEVCGLYGRYVRCGHKPTLDQYDAQAIPSPKRYKRSSYVS